jgi:hypothetical protein
MVCSSSAVGVDSGDLFREVGPGVCQLNCSTKGSGMSAGHWRISVGIGLGGQIGAAHVRKGA